MRRRVLAAVALLALTGCARTVDGTPSATLDCPRQTVALVRCVRASLTAFWTAQLHRPVPLRIRLDPSRAQVPEACQNALALRTAFTCPVDRVVYLTAPFVRRLRSTGPPGGAWLRIAATLGHETGHVVQLVERAPLVVKARTTEAESRSIEQQADCLSGVWATGVGVSPASFDAATAVVLRVVDSAWERRSHGGAAQRLAAVRRGEQGRAPAACGLQLLR